MVFVQSELRGATALVQEIKVSSPLVSAVIRILKRVDDFKKLAREFYFDVILSVHQCPRCGSRLEMTGKSECSCVCGNIFDPTIAFQKSACCGKHLVRKSQHYICSECGTNVPSMFLFDEKLFDKAYFREMVGYADKIVGQIVTKLKEKGLLENTVLIFTGDNGTHPTIYTHTASGLIRGGKGNTTDAGTRVPLIAHYPEGKQKGVVYEPLIEFSDFYPTLAEIAGIPVGEKEEGGVEPDGCSFFPVLTGSPHTPRETVFVHYDPKWGQNVNRFRNQFVRTLDYKLYADGRFFNLSSDVLEQNPLSIDSLSKAEAEEYRLLSKELEKHPDFLF